MLVLQSVSLCRFCFIIYNFLFFVLVYLKYTKIKCYTSRFNLYCWSILTIKNLIKWETGGLIKSPLCFTFKIGDLLVKSLYAVKQLPKLPNCVFSNILRVTNDDSNMFCMGVILNQPRCHQY